MYIKDCDLCTADPVFVTPQPRGCGSVGILGGNFTAYITLLLH